MTTKTTTRAFAYVRLSKDDLTTTSPQRQRAAIAQVCASRGWTLAETFEDIGVSATAKKRPAFSRMMSRLSQVDAVVVYRLDRLARSGLDFANILERFAEANVTLSATDMEVDNDSPGGTLIRDLVARLAQFERDQIAQRSKAMFAYKKSKGEWTGRVPYGWRSVGKHLEEDPEQQLVLQQVARRYASGETFSEIARDLGFQSGPLSRMLHSNRVQEALPDDLAGPLAEALVGRKWQRVPTSSQSLLGGMGRCGVCGGRMTQSSTRAGRQGRWRQYRCPTAGHVGISGPWLDAYVTEQVIAAIDTGEILKRLKHRKPGNSRKASEIEARMELLDQMFTEGKMTKARFERSNARLVEQLSDAVDAERGNGVDLPAELARNLAERFPEFTIANKRRIIAAVVERIDVDRAKSHGPIDAGRVAIVWRS